MWVVRFIRKDGKPDEEYFYPTFSDAEYHRRLLRMILLTFMKELKLLSCEKNGGYYARLKTENP